MPGLRGVLRWWLRGLVDAVWPLNSSSDAALSPKPIGPDQGCEICGRRPASPIWTPGRACLVCAGAAFCSIGHPCVQCSRPVPSLSPGPVCDECSSGRSLRRASSGYDRAVSLGIYREPLAGWIRQLKYDGRTSLAPPLGSMLSWAVEARLGPLDASLAAVVPVPLHPERLAHRGYNQATLVAESLAASLGLTVREDLIQRVDPGQPQASLDRQARHRAVATAFVPCVGRAARRSLLSPPPLALLVDDVLTTGATLNACAQALRECGIATVHAAVLAAGIPRRLWGATAS